MKTLKASLLASLIGTAACMFGMMGKIWPAHPMWALFFVTLGLMALLMYALPEPEKK